MKNALVNDLKSTLEQLSEKFQSEPKAKEFERATSEFKSLVEKGLIKERGYNLISVEDAHLHKIGFNTTY